MNETQCKCHFCGNPTQDGASIEVQRKKNAWDSQARILIASVFCCYGCFYERLLPKVKDVIPSVMKESKFN